MKPFPSTNQVHMQVIYSSWEVPVNGHGKATADTREAPASPATSRASAVLSLMITWGTSTQPPLTLACFKSLLSIQSQVADVLLHTKAPQSGTNFHNNIRPLLPHNKLPQQHQAAPSRHSFKTALKTELFHQQDLYKKK